MVYVAILLPIALVLIHNLVCTGFIIKSICRPRPGAGGRVRSNDEKQVLMERFRNSIAILSLLGLTWIFGFLAINGATLLFQWLFCIFNSFQGVFIFIFFCLKQKDVRETVFSSFRRSKQSTTASSTSGQLTSSRSGKSPFHSTGPVSNAAYDSTFSATPAPSAGPNTGTDNYRGLYTQSKDTDHSYESAHVTPAPVGVDIGVDNRGLNTESHGNGRAYESTINSIPDSGTDHGGFETLEMGGISQSNSNSGYANSNVGSASGPYDSIK